MLEVLEVMDWDTWDEEAVVLDDGSYLRACMIYKKLKKDMKVTESQSSMGIRYFPT